HRYQAIIVDLHVDGSYGSVEPGPVCTSAWCLPLPSTWTARVEPLRPSKRSGARRRRAPFNVDGSGGTVETPRPTESQPRSPTFNVDGSVEPLRPCCRNRTCWGRRPFNVDGSRRAVETRACPPNGRPGRSF